MTPTLWEALCWANSPSGYLFSTQVVHALTFSLSDLCVTPNPPSFFLLLPLFLLNHRGHSDHGGTGTVQASLSTY